MTYLRERLLGFREEQDEEDQARRTAMLFAVALIVVALGGLVFVLVSSGDGDSDGSSLSATSNDIGPVAGTELATYIPEREKALSDASGTRLAVVSFDQYATEADAKAAVKDVSVTKLLAAAPGGAPSEVTGSVAAWADEEVRASREERDELQRMLPTVDDPAFRDYYQTEINNLTALIDRVNPGAPLVFAAVVRGDADDLRKLARGATIRLVDVGSSAKSPPDAVYTGLRPEETTTAAEPPTRPA